ncbi:MAG: chemotaxis protein MotB [Deltaproteobacteria bacterium]|nr:MAG: chemotaxis protein MotB [Deltaproteobacteria bacterium]
MAAAEDAKPRVVVRWKKKGHAAHHGGAWKVAYADFVTAMMALFIVLWLLTQADMRLRQQVAQYFRSPGVLSGGSMITSDVNEAKSREPKVVSKDIIIVQGKGEQERLEGEANEIKAAVARAAQENPEIAKLKDQVIVQVTDAGLVIEVVDKGRNLLFDLSSADLKPALVGLLRNIAGVLAQMPNRIHVGGHTDSRPFPPGSRMTNWELSFHRADAARRVLEASGLRPGQIERVIAYADSQPLVAENPLADENRRLSILAARREAAPPPACEKPAEDVGPVSLPPDPLPPTG